MLFSYRTHDDSVPLHKPLLRLTLLMLVCNVVGYFYLRPFVARLREAEAFSTGVMSGGARALFGILNGASSETYLIQGLLGEG